MAEPGEYERAMAVKYRAAADAAEAEGDPNHAEDLRSRAEQIDMSVRKAVRRAREKRFGI